MLSVFSERIDQWIESQKNQRDGFEYERSYTEALQKIGTEVFQLSLGEIPKSKNQKKLQTGQGKVIVSKRHCLYNRSPFGMSHYLQYQCCYLGQQSVFRQAEEVFWKMKGLSVTSKQTEWVCHHYGEKFDEDYFMGKLAEKETISTPSSTPAYVMMDGGMVLTREREHPWKELKLGRIFHTKDYVQDISKKRNLITNSLYVGHLGGHRDFLSKLDYFIEAIPNASKIFIADGAPWIWKWIDEMYPDSTQVLDFFHVLEHLSAFASLYFKEQQEKTVWVKKLEKLLLEDQVTEVMEALTFLLPTISKKTVRESLEKLIRYYQNNEKRMKYKTFREQGYLIGSGAMESAIRNVVQQRLKLSGQRWIVPGGQQVLNIRTLFLSNFKNVLIDKIKNAA